MSSGFARPITIKKAIDNIDENFYLLPAIQRKFVWSSYQIEMLFDSIMRDYPINSFMFWEVKDSRIKNAFRFYKFLNEYREFFKDENPPIVTESSFKDFIAVIDGQQRLTGLYIGLKGSYAYKLPRKWWYNTEESIPTRHLYLNLSSPLPDENEKQAYYDFRFLTKKEYKNIADSTNDIWIAAHDILTVYDTRKKIDHCIDQNGWINLDYTKDTLRKFYGVIFDDEIINYYLEEKQKLDTVLDIFIRTNSGGEPLSFSDLLMAITTAKFKQHDARKEIPDVVNKVFAISSPGFMINKDFVLKTWLTLFSDNLKFRVKNFDQNSIAEFEHNWYRIKQCIIETFNLLSKMGFNNQNLRAKNAAIPIIYYIYHRGIENDINNPLRYIDEKTSMKKWLCMSLLKGVFGGQSDNVLTTIRKSIKIELNDNSSTKQFPLKSIKEAFKSDPLKNLSFDDEIIDGMLTAQFGSPECYAVMSLLYSHLNFDQELHMDHLHPASYFKNIKREDFANDNLYSFYSDPANWNSVANLQLLNSIHNQSKQAKPLADWINQNNVDLDNQLLPKNVSYDIADFQTFIENRKTLLKGHLKSII